jgi:hypothetical protein
MRAPQIIFICIRLFGLGIMLSQHGKPKKGKENFWIDLAATAITFGLLIWGGFFN